MMPKDSRQRKRCPACNILFAVVHVLWITAFFVSTENNIFQQYQCDFLKYSCIGVPALFRVRLFILSCGISTGGIPECRSPPSDFDFASQPKNRDRRIIHEENKSAGLLPVLHKRHCC